MSAVEVDAWDGDAAAEPVQTLRCPVQAPGLLTNIKTR